MRFSLRTLLLLFPTLIVSYALAYFWEGLTQRHGHWVWESQRHQVRMLAEAFHPPKVVSVVNANLFLQKQLPASHPHYTLYKSWLYECEDCWQKPLVCVGLSERDEPDPELDLTHRVGFYSCGKDGVSYSHGNDPHDLNSWNSTEQYYRELGKQITQEHRQRAAYRTTPWFFGAIICFWGLNYWVRKTSF